MSSKLQCVTANIYNERGQLGEAKSYIPDQSLTAYYSFGMAIASYDVNFLSGTNQFLFEHFPISAIWNNVW